MNEKYFLKKVPVPITITKGDELIYVNEETENLTGYKEEELIGKDVSLLYPSLFEFKNIKFTAVKNKGIRGMRTKLKRKDGKILNVSVNVNLLEYEDGTSGGIGAVFDITPIIHQEDRLQENIKKLYMLYNVLKTITSSLNLDDIIKSTVEAIKEYFGIEVIGISVLTEKDGEKYVKVKYYIGYDFKKADKYTKLHLEEWKEKANIVYTISTGKISYIPDVTKDYKRYLNLDPDIRSSLALPIKAKDEILGGIVLESKEVDIFKKEDIELLTIIADMLATVMLNARLYEKTLELSIKDALTGVYNHRYFYDQLHKEIERYERYGIPFSLAILDLDKFKEVNDTYGHIEGDKVLRKIGKLLEENVRKHIDTVCRYGGDEFSIIFSNTYLNEAKNVVDRIIEIINKNHEKLHNITISIGLGEYRGEEDSQFIAKVDALTYKAKKKGGNKVEIEDFPISI